MMTGQVRQASLCGVHVTRTRIWISVLTCGWNDADHADTQVALPRHSVISGRYYIGRILGQGGFGITYLGWDLKLERRVAVKEYFPLNQCTRLADRLSIQPYAG